MLTKKQKNLLIFINKKIRSSGISPSYEEMKNSLNLNPIRNTQINISIRGERFCKKVSSQSKSIGSCKTS